MFKIMNLKFGGDCHECGKHLKKGVVARYYRKLKAVACLDCAITEDSINTNTMPDPGMIDSENFVNEVL